MNSELKAFINNIIPPHDYYCELIGGIDYLALVKDYDNKIHVNNLNNIINTYNFEQSFYYLDLISKLNNIDYHRILSYVQRIKGKFIIIIHKDDEVFELFKEFYIRTMDDILIITNFDYEYVYIRKKPNQPLRYEFMAVMC